MLQSQLQLARQTYRDREKIERARQTHKDTEVAEHEEGGAQEHAPVTATARTPNLQR